MSGLLSRITGFYESLPDRLRRNRIMIWISLAVILGVLASGLGRLKVDMSMETWFQDEDPAIKSFIKFKDSFGSDDSIYIVYRAKDGDVLSEVSLNTLASLQEELTNASIEAVETETSTLDRIVEIKSLINVSYMEVEGDSLNSRDFIGDEIPEVSELREIRRKEALDHNDYPEFYISHDSQYGGIFIRTDFGTIPVDEPDFDEEAAFGSDIDLTETSAAAEPETVRYQTTAMGEYDVFVAEIYEILNKPEYQDKLAFYPVGTPVIMKFFNEVLAVEFSYVFSGTLLLMAITLFVLFRSLSAVAWPITIIILAIIGTLGLIGWLGITMTMMISVLVMLLLVVGVASSIHILSGYLFFRKRNYDHQKALRAVMKKSGFACMLTSITTSVGLVSMILVPIPPIAKFGFSAAIGVLGTFLLMITLLPLLLDIWHPISEKQEKKMQAEKQKASLVQTILGFLETFVYQYPKRIVVVFLIISAIGLYGVVQVKVNTNYIEVARKTNPIYLASVLVDKVMGGTQSMELTLDFNEDDALKKPNVLNAMEQMQLYLNEEHSKFVVKTESLVNVVKNSFKVLNQNREEMYIIPQDQRTLHQVILLVDNANSDDRRLLVTDNYAEGRINIRLKNYGSNEYLEFFEEVKNQAGVIFEPLKTAYPNLEFHLTGNLPLTMQLMDYMSWAQVQSFGLALIVITLMLLFVFGSPKIGLIGMIPNVFPVIMTFSVMGFLGIPLDADTLIIAPIVIGIAVDDTIHFLSHFRTDMLETGSIPIAVSRTFKEVGQAIFFYTTILVLGFIVMIFMSHMGLARFGYLTGVAFISAFFGDLLLLPALCILMEGKKKRGAPEKLEDAAVAN